MLQAAATGLACVALIMAANQRAQTEAMARAAVLLGMVADPDPARVRSAVATALRRDDRDAVGARAASLIDGQGASRAAQGIIRLYTSSAEGSHA